MPRPQHVPAIMPPPQRRTERVELKGVSIVTVRSQWVERGGSCKGYMYDDLTTVRTIYGSFTRRVVRNTQVKRAFMAYGAKLQLEWDSKTGVWEVTKFEPDNKAGIPRSGPTIQANGQQIGLYHVQFKYDTGTHLVTEEVEVYGQFSIEFDRTNPQRNTYWSFGANLLIRKSGKYWLVVAHAPVKAGPGAGDISWIAVNCGI